MSSATPFRHLRDELIVFNRNLVKDNTARRLNPDANARKLQELARLREEFENLRAKFNEQRQEDKVKEEVKEYVQQIGTYFKNSEVILRDRLAETKASQGGVVTRQSNLETIHSKMAEKFCLKTAASLLPVMNGSEDVTRQLIDSIELYDTLLDESGKKLLVVYVLKTRLSQSAKIRLQKSYVNSESLIADIKKHFITIKSTASLSVQLNGARQGSRSVEDFGNAVEQLLVELSISQADGDEQALNVLRKANEKVAVNVFANGLQNGEVRTILKARNYNSLSDAIRGAKDEESTGKEFHQAFHMRGRDNFRRGAQTFVNSYRGGGTPSFRNQNNTFMNTTKQFTPSFRGRGTHNRGHDHSYRGRFSSNRGSNSNNYRYISNNHRNYYMGEEEERVENSDTSATTPASTDAFFRVPQD